MKKRMLLAAAVAMLLAMTACGAGDVGSEEYMAQKNASSQAAQESSQPVQAQASDKEVEDNLAGLQSYLEAAGYLSGTPSEMQAGLIGAKSGVKYLFGYEGNNNVTVELYEFDLENLDDTAQAVIDGVKASGKFEIMEREVSAQLSDNGKYLMIYTDTASGDAHTVRTEEVRKAFQEFKKET